MPRRPATKNIGAVAPAPPATPAAPTGPRPAYKLLRPVPVEKVPVAQFGRTGERAYKDIEDALRATPAKQALPVGIPDGVDAGKFASNVLNSLRRVLPGTRSRTAKEERLLYLWLGEPGKPRTKKAAERVA